ncbi:MAG: hypothetical protein IPH86_16450 [bacterium]|nr:hypothetical protein [bacterium]
MALLPALCVSAGRAAAADEPPAPAAIFPDSLLLQAPDFAALRPDLLPLTTARVAETAWDLVPRLVYADRPDLLVDFLDFWEDRCGRTSRSRARASWPRSGTVRSTRACTTRASAATWTTGKGATRR